MTSDLFNIVNTESSHKNDNTLSSLKELLGAGEVQESQQAELSVEHRIERSDCTFKHLT